MPARLRDLGWLGVAVLAVGLTLAISCGSEEGDESEQAAASSPVPAATAARATQSTAPTSSGPRHPRLADVRTWAYQLQGRTTSR